jgi:hypothetical protein
MRTGDLFIADWTSVRAIHLNFASRQLIAFGGLENAFDRQNFLGIAWLPRYGLVGVCKRSASECVSYQNQMGLFPNFGANFVF